MTFSFRRIFQPTPEEIEADRQFLEKLHKDLVAEKRCCTCMNSYKEHWNNHGHDDSLTMCTITGECREYGSGMDCEHYEEAEEENVEIEKTKIRCESCIYRMSEMQESQIPGWVMVTCVSDDMALEIDLRPSHFKCRKYKQKEG